MSKLSTGPDYRNGRNAGCTAVVVDNRVELGAVWLLRQRLPHLVCDPWLGRQSPPRFRTIQVCPKDLPSAPWQARPAVNRPHGPSIAGGHSWAGGEQNPGVVAELVSGNVDVIVAWASAPECEGTIKESDDVGRSLSADRRKAQGRHVRCWGTAANDASARCSSQMTGNAAVQSAPIAQNPAGPKRA